MLQLEGHWRVDEVEMFFSTIQDLLCSELLCFLSFADLEYGYTVSIKDLIVNWLHCLHGNGSSEVAEYEDWMNVLDLTLVFKCKRLLAELIKKFNTHFCTRGYQQVEGVYIFKAYAPVVQ